MGLRVGLVGGIIGRAKIAGCVIERGEARDTAVVVVAVVAVVTVVVVGDGSGSHSGFCLTVAIAEY